MLRVEVAAHDGAESVVQAVVHGGGEVGGVVECPNVHAVQRLQQEEALEGKEGHALLGAEQRCPPDSHANFALGALLAHSAVGVDEGVLVPLGIKVTTDSLL